MRPVGHRVLPGPGRQVDQRPQVGRPGQRERGRRVATAPGGVRRQHGVGERLVAVEAQQVAEVGVRVAAVGVLPVEDRRDLERVGVDQQVLRVQVAVHQAGPGDGVEQRLGLDRDRAQAGQVVRAEAGQPVGVQLDEGREPVDVPEAADASGRRPRTARAAASASRRGRPAGPRAATRAGPGRRGPGWAAARRRGCPRRTTSRAGRGARTPASARRTSSTSGTGTRPRTSRSSAASTSWAASPRGPGPGVDPDHAPLPRRVGQERLAGPAAGQRGQGGEVHAAIVPRADVRPSTLRT